MAEDDVNRALDLGGDFDPRIDPVVRVQAAKLRAKLIEYYAGPGADDAIVIGVPKGSYAAEIQRRDAPETVRPSTVDRSRIAVLPFVNMRPTPTTNSSATD